MPGIRRVINVEFDGGSGHVTFGRQEVPFIKANYADMLETEVVRTCGSQRQNARTAGTYKTDTCSITFRCSEFRAILLPLFPKNGFGNIRRPIVSNFDHPEIGSDSDLLDGARCVNLAQAIENSNKGLEVETKWELDQIYWGSDRRTINTLDGPLGLQLPIGTVGF